MKVWKQPIPSNLDKVFGDDKKAMMLYILLLTRARNTPTTVQYGKNFIPLKRGDAIFGRDSVSKYFELSPSGIEGVLKRLELTGKVTCTRSFNCTVVSIVSFDSVTSMQQPNQQVTNRLPTGNQQVATTNKSVLESGLENESENEFYPEKIFELFCISKKMSFKNDEERKQMYLSNELIITELAKTYSFEELAVCFLYCRRFSSWTIHAAKKNMVESRAFYLNLSNSDKRKLDREIVDVEKRVDKNLTTT